MNVSVEVSCRDKRPLFKMELTAKQSTPKDAVGSPYMETHGLCFTNFFIVLLSLILISQMFPNVKKLKDQTFTPRI